MGSSANSEEDQATGGVVVDGPFGEFGDQIRERVEQNELLVGVQQRPHQDFVDDLASESVV